MKIGHSKRAEHIRIELQQKASSVFMWVVLVVGILNKEHDSGRVHTLQEKLRDIPGDLHELFRDILTRDDCDRNELVLCIQWVLFATQPLSPEQLYFAILSSVDPAAFSKWDHDEISTHDIERFILSSSKGLAETTKSKNAKVQFIHESVRDFLLKENGISEIWSHPGSNIRGESHERLKTCCLNYMAIDIYSHVDFDEPLPKASSYEAATLRKSTVDAFPFLKYAVRNVLHHADAAQEEGINQRNFIENFQLDDWIKLDNLFEQYEIRRHTPDASLLYILAEGNMSSLIGIHPSVLSYLELEDERYGPPLFASLATGSEKAAHAFLKAHAVKEPQRTKLNRLCDEYCQDRNRQVNLGRDFRFSSKRTVLSYMAKLGHELLFAILFETGNIDADTEMKDGYGRTMLSWAAEKGNEAVVNQLLKKGADTELKDKPNQTPLLWAVKKGHKAIVTQLLNNGADIKIKDEDNRTPLSWAAKRGHKAVVEQLLENGADIKTKDKYGWTPLSWAAESGHKAVVKLLLNNGANIEAKESNSQTSLLWAAERGHEALVKLLLENGANIKIKGRKSHTSLSWAAEKGHEAVVKLLLKNGANINTKDDSGRTPLSWAVEKGHDAVVKLLEQFGNS